MYLYRRMFTAEDMLIQDEYLTGVSRRMMIIGKDYYEDTSWNQLCGCRLISFHVRAL